MKLIIYWQTSESNEGNSTYISKNGNDKNKGRVGGQNIYICLDIHS